MRPAGHSRQPGPRHAGHPAAVDTVQEADEPRTRGQRALRHAGRGARFFLFAAIPFVVLVALALALTYVRLRHGPISLSFLVPPIERSINAVMSGYVARVEDAIVRLTDGNRLEFRLQNIRFAEADGDLVASSPLAAIEISRQALLQGRLVPSRVELIRPELFLTYAPAEGLGLKFAAPEAPSASEPSIESPPSPRPAMRPVASGAPTLKSIDFGRLVRNATDQARQSQGAASFMREFGVRDATLHVDNQGHRTTWQLPELGIDLDHKENRSVIVGRARVAAGSGSWHLAFHTEHVDKGLTLRTSVRGLVPSSLFELQRTGSLLSLIDLPVGADMTFGFAPNGDATSTEVDIEIGRGNVMVRDAGGHLNPVPVEAGRIRLAYDPATTTWTIPPSTIQADDKTVTFGGTARRAAFDGDAGWAFEVASHSGVFGASEFSPAPIPLDALTVRGRYLSSSQRVEIDAAEVRAGGATVTAEGTLSLRDDQPGVRFKASTSPMQFETLKAMWPAGLAPKSRAWVGRNVTSGYVRRLDFRRETGLFAERGDAGPVERMTLSIEAENGSFRPSDTMPPVTVPRALIGIENDLLEISAPDATLMLPSGKTMALKGGRLASANVHAEPPAAELSFRAQSDIAAAIELLRHEPMALFARKDLPVKSLDGKVDAQLAMAFPMMRDLPASRVKVSGKAKVSDGRAQKLFGNYDVQGASVAFDFTNGAVEAKGEAIVRGVLARISWQHIFDAPEDRQPPLRITATLDNTDRKQLGIDINHLVTGEVPIDMQVVRGTVPGEHKLHVRAELTNAEVLLPAIAWRKAPGRNAFAEFDVAPAAQGRHELQNFRLAGDNIAIEGWVAIGPDQKLKEFYFPDFSLNVVSRLKVQGSLGADNVWDIKARGTTFDGKDYFRSLFSVGRISENQDQGKSFTSGIDLDVQIDNVLGFAEQSMRGLKLKLKNRSGKITELDARATLEGGAPLAVVLDRGSGGQRRIRADSTDAGQAFKVIGFYPNMQKGRVQLELNVDGSGAAEKTGTLWVSDFRILGDPVVSEVVSSGLDDGRPSISGKKRVTREVFEFEKMRVPFSVGHGQFVMDDAYVNGPLLGATVRGKVDYKTERISLGGTYVPLQGLNNLFGQIPVLGQILSGPRGEGIFGITFAVQGAMADPQVIVNPFSLVAPGILREIFQLNNPSTQVQERKETQKRQPRSQGSSSSSAVKRGGQEPTSKATIDGWSSDTKKP